MIHLRDTGIMEYVAGTFGIAKEGIMGAVQAFESKVHFEAIVLVDNGPLHCFFETNLVLIGLR